MQKLIGIESYYVISFISTCKSSDLIKNLIKIVSPMVHTPPTIKKEIEFATPLQMIKRINDGDKHQLQWFRALLNTNVFDHEDSIKCVDRWAHLCNMNDVSKLLNLSACCQERLDYTDLIIKCVSTLNNYDIIMLTSKYYHEHGFEKFWKQVGDHSVVKVLNGMVNDPNTTAQRELVLELFSNPMNVMQNLLKYCIRSEVLFDFLNGFFHDATGVFEIDNIYVDILKNVMGYNNVDDTRPNSQNIKCYEKIFTIFIRDFSDSRLKLTELIKGYVELCMKDDRLEDLFYGYYLYSVSISNNF